MNHLVVGVLALAGLVALGGGASPIEPARTPDRAAYDKVVRAALDQLRLRGQAEDGSFSSELGPGVTAVVITGALQTGRVTPNEPWIARGLKYLESFVKPDGGIYESRHDNYTTSVALMAFAAANKDGRYNSLIAGAQKFIKGLQWDESDGTSQDNPAYGGIGYDSKKRADLSNTQIAMEALVRSGIDSKDESLQKALRFLSQCQNLPSEHNRQEFAVKTTDDDRGGSIYTPVGKGESKAGESPGGGLRSYGSMSYAGLKSMIYAALDKKDPRVASAVDWARRHWSVTENPGMGQVGLYYYYQTLAKALDALGDDVFVDSKGARHAWRVELFEELARRQRPDGSWVNPADRWYEGDANLVTGYVLMALSHVKPAPAAGK
jgi:squalene-hopene/tetraprenyl-beta-curcumene cyclase